MNNLDTATKIAKRILNTPTYDPDSDVVVLAREFLKLVKERARLLEGRG